MKKLSSIKCFKSRIVKIPTVASVASVTSSITLTGVPSTGDYISLYDLTTLTVIPMNGTLYIGRSYKVVTNYTIYDTTSIGRYIQYNTPDWYGLWINAYNSTTNPTGFPTTGTTIINGKEYVLWPYTLTLTSATTQTFYLYGLGSGNTIPTTPTTMNAKITLTVA